MIEQIIDEMQALLTKFRGQARSEKAGECTKCAKIEAILEERIHGNMPDCRCGICMRVVDVIWPDSKPETAGECICTHRMLPNHDCPKHGWVVTFKEQKAAYDRLNKTPDLPLNAKVAKALGKRVMEIAKYGWQMGDKEDSPTGYIPISPYDTDLEAAMGALEEYTAILPSSVYMRYSIQHSDGGLNRRERVIGIRGARHCFAIDLPLPQAICLAIVAHREGK